MQLRFVFLDVLHAPQERGIIALLTFCLSVAFFSKTVLTEVIVEAYCYKIDFVPLLPSSLLHVFIAFLSLAPATWLDELLRIIGVHF